MSAGKTFGLHVALLGIDGAGKTTQAGLLTKRLNDGGFPTYLAEGKDDFASEMLKVVAKTRGSVREHAGTEQVDLLVGMDHLRTYARLALPYLAAGINVVTPRDLLSRLTLARANGSNSNQLLTELLSIYPPPDLTIFVDVDPGLAHTRITSRAKDNEDLELLQRLALEMRSAARSEGFVWVDGAAGTGQVHHEILAAVQEMIPGLRL